MIRGVYSMKLKTYIFLIPLLFVTSISFSKEVDFNKQILPILSDNCFDCHGPDKHSRKAKLRLDTKEGLYSQIDFDKVREGDLLASPLIERVVTTDEDDLMPPSESHRSLTESQISLLKQWVKEGADYEEHWSFVPPKKAKVSIKDTSAIQNEIDRYVLAKLENKGLSLKEKAKPETLCRRIHLLLNGLPPTQDELDSFVTDFEKRGQMALEARVDTLLNNPAYGEHNAWSWLEAARYADTSGYQSDSKRIMWRWKDWLIEALNENIPYDQLTIQMLAGDLLIPKDEQNWQTGDYIRNDEHRKLITATGFLRNHRYDLGSGTIPAESKFENAADRLETVGTVWMGLTMQCARCHDHKFDPISAEDYYRMMAVFDKVSEVGSAVSRANSHPYIITPTAEQKIKCDELDKSLSKLESEILKEKSNFDQQLKNWLRSKVKKENRVSRNLKFHFAMFAENTVPKAKEGKVINGQGILGNSWEFDGKTNVELKNEVSLLLGPRRRWTLAAWIKVDEYGEMAVMGSMLDPANRRRGVQIEVIEGKVRLRQISRWFHSAIEIVSKEKLEIGKWHHVAFSNDSRNQGLAYKAWLDGSQDKMEMTREVNNDGAAGRKGEDVPFNIGKLPHVKNLRGAVADIRLYDRDLDDEEVKILAFNKPLSQLEDRRLIERHVYDEELTGDLAVLWENLVNTRLKRQKYLDSLPTTMVMDHDSLRQTYFHARGAYDKKEQRLMPGALSAFNRNDVQVSNRLDFAKWLVSGEHPLTGRVIVNRLWTQLWGRGFVDTPENFGTQCAEPEHRELLDFLTVRFIDNGWDMKETLKYIILSAAWQQSSQANEEEYKADPENKLLSRGPRFRLPASVIRDQALHVSGILKHKIGGPPVAIGKLLDRKGSKINVAPYNTTRRSVYTFWKRNQPFPFFKPFDTADRTMCDVRVIRTNTPLQALITLNEKSLFDSAKELAKQVAGVEGGDNEKIQWLYRTVTASKASASQLSLLKNSLESYRLHYKQNTGGTSAISKDSSGIEQAAWATLANVVMNLDRTLCLE